MSLPKVSIGIPVYNAERYLRVAVDSVLEQDYEDFELIISDNASADKTNEICNEYAAKDPRIRYVRNEVNIGAIPNFNRVFQLSRGEFFKWLSYDDACYPTLLRRCMEVWDCASQSTTLVYPRCEMMDAGGHFESDHVENVETRAPHSYQRLWKVIQNRSSAQALLGLIRADHLRKTRLRGSYVMDDMGLLAELSLLGEFVEVKEVLIKVRVHQKNANRIHTTIREQSIWLDPTNLNKRFVLIPALQLFVEAFRSIRHVRIGRGEKVLCSIAVIAAYATLLARGFATRLHRRLSRALSRLSKRQRNRDLVSGPKDTGDSATIRESREII